MDTGALPFLPHLFAALAGLSATSTLAGTFATLGFSRQRVQPAASRPPISVLKPLCGEEPLLEEALATFCQLDYPQYELVFGVQSPTDLALAVVERLRVRFPDLHITTVVNPVLHGINRKVSNLVNMLPAARYDLLVFADSDVHVPPDYLLRVGDALSQPGVGLVTALAAGRVGVRNLSALLGSVQISHAFLPGVILSRMLGRQDCLGTTMALQRDVLNRVGGLPVLLRHLADDHVLGRRVRALGLKIGLAPVVTSTTVSEKSFATLWAHELRWGRTMGAVEAGLFVTSALQYPLFWAGLAVAFSCGAAPYWLLFIAAWAIRAGGIMGVNRTLRRAPGAGGWRLAAAAIAVIPVRDVLSIAIVAASYCGDRVTWRGHVLYADNGLGWSAAD